VTEAKTARAGRLRRLPAVTTRGRRDRLQLSGADRLSGRGGRRVRVERIGTSSVCHGVRLFRGDEDRASAAGYFVHVDRRTRRPRALPEPLRRVLEAPLRLVWPRRGSPD
jgi:hypothetical protein